MGTHRHTAVPVRKIGGTFAPLSSLFPAPPPNCASGTTSRTAERRLSINRAWVKLILWVASSFRESKRKDRSSSAAQQSCSPPPGPPQHSPLPPPSQEVEWPCRILQPPQKKGPSLRLWHTFPPNPTVQSFDLGHRQTGFTAAAARAPGMPLPRKPVATSTASSQIRSVSGSG